MFHPQPKESDMRTSAMKLAVFAAVVGAAMFAPEAMASVTPDNGGVSVTDDGVFDGVVEKLVSWLTGGLGKSAALACLLAGGVAAVVRSNLYFVLLGVGMALAFAIGPSLVLNVFSATLPAFPMA
jgi:type IV secretory pathway VirB2 component (pilin)